jgi:hypothetical protein
MTLIYADFDSFISAITVYQRPVFRKGGHGQGDEWNKNNSNKNCLALLRKIIDNAAEQVYTDL